MAMSNVYGSEWLNPQLAPVLLGVIVLAAVGTAILFGVSLVVYSRRGSVRYLLITIILGLLVGRSIVGLGTVFGITPMTVHHLVEHGVDFVIAVLILYAVYRSGPTQLDPAASESADDPRFDDRTRRTIVRHRPGSDMVTRYGSVAASVLLVVALLGTGWLFVADVGATEPPPARFEDTVPMGVTFEEEAAERSDVQFPQTQVFYSQYEYVVGYWGVERFVDARRQPDHERRFGYPLAVYVTDYAGTEVEVTEDGYPVVDGPIGWVDAESAVYVVDSDARTPAGETVVPFSDREGATAYAESHGGSVLTWTELEAWDVEVDDAGTVRDRLDDRLREADDRREAAGEYLERPPSLVVGEDADSIQAAVDEAPPESTVVVSEGTYEEGLEIDRPITLVGDGNVTIRGDGEGTVVSVTADRAAIADVRITGVGDTIRPEEREAAADSEDVLEMAYGQGDAGVEVEEAAEVLVENVTIETPANGVLLRDSPEAIVREVTVLGSDAWEDGYMDVLTMRSPDGLVEDSRFVGGRDGLYTHRSNGLIYRNNTVEDVRIGIHLMYTDDVVIADNRITDTDSTGIDLMTNPDGIAVVGNEIRDNPQGLLTDGTNAYVARNAIADNDLGLTTAAGNSIYEHNVIAGNGDGMLSNQLLPTNRVVGNDFVGNYRHAAARVGTLRVWTADGRGNYWHGAVGEPDGAVLDRSYSPTGAVDEGLHRVDGTPTLARAPALDAITTFEAAVPGMRDASIVDTAPLCEPANPDLLATTDWQAPERECGAGAPAAGS